MGLSLLFIVGDAVAIAAALRPGAHESLNQIAAAVDIADFSLHLEPRDLDRLSGALGHGGETPAQPLRPYLELLWETSEAGCFRVARPWAAYVAANRHRHSGAFIAAAWVAAMARAHAEPELAVTDAAIGAITRLRALCTRVASGGPDLVHAWWL